MKRKSYLVSTTDMAGECLKRLSRLEDRIASDLLSYEEVAVAAMLLAEELAVVVASLDIPKEVVMANTKDMARRVQCYDIAVSVADSIESDALDSIFI